MKGGGVYVYRTRKPASLIGKIPLPEKFMIPIGVAVATVPVLAVGAPWWVSIPAGLLLTGRHFGYVGETTSFEDRHLQHVGGQSETAKFKAEPKPWADLRPVCVLRIRLPRWKWLLRSVETLVMLVTWPVYNDQKNRWNPRRIPLISARRQRFKRDGRDLKLSWNFRSLHVLGIIFWLVMGVMFL